MNGLLKSETLSFSQIQKIRKSMYESFYIVDSVVTVHGFTIKLTGSTLNVYTIKYSTVDNILRCNCPNSEICKATCVYCKHICFVICGIGKIYEENVFLNLRLEDYQLFKIIFKLQMNCFDDPNIICEMLIDRYKTTLIRNLQIKDCPMQFHPNNPNNLKEDCPICYLKLDSDLCECPDCKNSVHLLCMQKWFKYNKNCIFCRSEEWKKFEIYVGDKYLNISK